MTSGTTSPERGTAPPAWNGGAHGETHMLDQYGDLEGIATTLGVKNCSLKEVVGKVQIAGTTT